MEDDDKKKFLLDFMSFVRKNVKTLYIKEYNSMSGHFDDPDTVELEYNRIEQLVNKFLET